MQTPEAQNPLGLPETPKSNSAKIIGCSLLVAAVVAAAGFGALVYKQGQEFDRIVQNPNAYLGANIPELAVKVTDSRFMGRHFQIGRQNADQFEPYLDANADFGLSPTITAKPSVSQANRASRFLNAIKLDIQTSFNWRGIPKNLHVSTQPSKFEEDNVVIKLGSIQADSVFDKPQNVEGRVPLFANFVTDIKLDSFSFGAGNDSFSGGAQQLRFGIQEDGPEYLNLKYEYAGLKLVDRSSLSSYNSENGQVSVKLTGQNTDLKQSMQWSIGPSKAKSALFSMKMQDFSGDVNIFMPNQPEMLGILANELIGEETCRCFPKICQNGRFDALRAQKALSVAFRDGKAWIDVQKAKLALKEGSLQANGQLRFDAQKSQAGLFNIDVNTQDANIVGLIQGFMPRGAFTQEGDNFKSTLVLAIENGRLVLRANQVEIVRL